MSDSVGVFSVIKGWFGFTQPDVPDPTTGMTRKQINHVQNTWKIVRKNAAENGQGLFLALFGAYPEYQKLFPAFADVPRSELNQSKKFKAHASTVIYSLSSCVDSLDDPDCLVALLTKIGCNHVPRKVKACHFENLKKVLVDFLKKALGAKVMTDDVIEAWEVMLKVATMCLVSGLEQHKDKK